jgi:hypothetical protein
MSASEGLDFFFSSVFDTTRLAHERPKISLSLPSSTVLAICLLCEVLCEVFLVCDPERERERERAFIRLLRGNVYFGRMCERRICVLVTRK